MKRCAYKLILFLFTNCVTKLSVFLFQIVRTIVQILYVPSMYIVLHTWKWCKGTVTIIFSMVFISNVHYLFIRSHLNMDLRGVWWE